MRSGSSSWSRLASKIARHFDPSPYACLAIFDSESPDFTVYVSAAAPAAGVAGAVVELPLCTSEKSAFGAGLPSGLLPSGEPKGFSGPGVITLLLCVGGTWLANAVGGALCVPASARIDLTRLSLCVEKVPLRKQLV